MDRHLEEDLIGFYGTLNFRYSEPASVNSRSTLPARLTYFGYLVLSVGFRDSLISGYSFLEKFRPQHFGCMREYPRWKHRPLSHVVLRVLELFR